MKIAGHTEESIMEAVENASARLGDNLTLKQLERDGKTGKSKYLNVRITVKATRDKAGNILPGVHTTRNFARTSTGGYPDVKGYRANSAASWDAHGVFFEELYKLEPDTLIRSGSVANGGVVLESRYDLRKHWR